MYLYQEKNNLIIILCIVVIVSSAFFFYPKLIKSEGHAIEIKTKEKENLKMDFKKKVKTHTVRKKIVVHLGGEVVNPGVYHCHKKTRLYKVLEQAGGATNKADLNAINLANLVRDGEKIIIPSLVSKDKTTAKTSKININTATPEELETVAGIGPVTAKKIIDFRKNNGAFEELSALTKVAGIGPKTLENIKDKIIH
ncbi:MAG: helix-hairpin-helix domain-containing protein [Bacillota bacterium]